MLEDAVAQFDNFDIAAYIINRGTKCTTETGVYTKCMCIPINDMSIIGDKDQYIKLI